MIGRLHSLQSLGTVDGPGVRAVAFLSGCPLRCAFCHNPDTWDPNGGEEIEASELADRLCRFRTYFGREGGVTLSGGEPLMQARFSAEIFRLLKERGIHTALDTSGCLPVDAEIAGLLDVTDYVLLDVKFDFSEDYLRYTRADRKRVLAFLDELDRRRIPTRLRRVVIPTMTDSPESVLRLAELAAEHRSVVGVELLPFRKLCLPKYEAMGKPFPLDHLPEASGAQVLRLQQLLDARLVDLKKSNEG